MPYGIRKQGNQHCVYNKDTSKTVPGGCHSAEGQAEAHMRALYANVDDASQKKSEGQRVRKAVKGHNSPDAQRASAKATDYTWKGR